MDRVMSKVQTEGKENWFHTVIDIYANYHTSANLHLWRWLTFCPMLAFTAQYLPVGPPPSFGTIFCSYMKVPLPGLLTVHKIWTLWYYNSFSCVSIHYINRKWNIILLYENSTNLSILALISVFHEERRIERNSVWVLFYNPMENVHSKSGFVIFCRIWKRKRKQV